MADEATPQRELPTWRQSQVDRTLLLRSFATAHQVMPNAAEVLRVLGDDAFYRYTRVQNQMRELWNEVGDDV